MPASLPSLTGFRSHNPQAKALAAVLLSPLVRPLWSQIFPPAAPSTQAIRLRVVHHVCETPLPHRVKRSYRKFWEIIMHHLFRRFTPCTPATILHWAQEQIDTLSTTDIPPLTSTDPLIALLVTRDEFTPYWLAAFEHLPAHHASIYRTVAHEIAQGSPSAFGAYLWPGILQALQEYWRWPNHTFATIQNFLQDPPPLPLTTETPWVRLPRAVQRVLGALTPSTPLSTYTATLFTLWPYYADSAPSESFSVWLERLSLTPPVSKKLSALQAVLNSLPLQSQHTINVLPSQPARQALTAVL